MAPQPPFTIRGRLAEPTRVAPPFVERPPFPNNMMVELSNACNHACVFCANPKSTRPIGRLDGDLPRRLLREARDLGVREVGFYTTGDPFVHIDQNRHEVETVRERFGSVVDDIYFSRGGTQGGNKFEVLDWSELNTENRQVVERRIHLKLVP